ncbi:MAG: hypothetical protein JWO56_2318 [Acidobacteria bacterium]|nr:hypothetical protein [Acidobacteriota bacterium]
MIFFLLLAVTATFHPARPTVGDPVTLEFRQPAALNPSPDYEIVSQSGNRIVIRTFRPGPLALSGRTGDVAFRNLAVPVTSVLKPKDDLQPAPLAPPRAEPYPRIAWYLIAIAGALAALAWLAVWWRARRRAAEAAPVPQLPPLERYRATVLALRDDPRVPKRWAALADATRAYLAAIDPALGAELTTSELLRRNGNVIVAGILHLGDLEKFSPYGAPPADFASLAERALTELAPERKPEEEAAA